jgi:glycosyl transferase family 87
MIPLNTARAQPGLSDIMASKTARDPWLTRKRLRMHGFSLALGLWSIYAWNMSAPSLRDRGGNLKGTDFLHLYTLGSIALEHRGSDLYNTKAQADLSTQRVPAAAGIIYVPLLPPQVSVFFAPWARLPYPWALGSWLIVSGLLYGLSCYLIWRTCHVLGEERRAVLWLAIAFPGFFHLILWGQASALALVCFTLAYLALRGEHEFLAGLALGSLMFKPQLGVAAAVIFLVTQRWKVIAGAALAAMFQVAIAWAYFGADSLREWVRVLFHLFNSVSVLEPKLYQSHSLRSFWALLFPSPGVSLALYAVSACVVLIVAIACWRSSLPLQLRYCALLLASVLVSPHLIVYDLVILAPAILFFAEWLATQPHDRLTAAMTAPLCLAYLSPLLGPLSLWTHLQISVIAMTGLMGLMWQLSRRSTVVELFRSL